MRNFFSFILLILLATAAQADTIYLKNGSVIKGKVTGFADDQFTILLDAGGGRYLSRATIYMGDVSRIEFDSSSQATEAPPRETTVKTQPEAAPPKETSTKETSTKETTPKETPAQPSEPPRVSPPPETQPSTSVTEAVEKPANPPAETKPARVVRTQTVEIAAKKDWTSTQMIVKRGDRISVTASGTVTLDQAGARTSGPEGIDLPDPRKLMADQPTGALIAVIGADNDDFIFIGRQSEFTATRDGLLFLSVNEGALSDNSGSYKAVIEIFSPQKNK